MKPGKRINLRVLYVSAIALVGCIAPIDRPRASSTTNDYVGSLHTLIANKFDITAQAQQTPDWNFGYQYYNYNESTLVGPRPQNYHAHLPYTSLRLYFGRKE